MSSLHSMPKSEIFLLLLLFQHHPTQAWNEGEDAFFFFLCFVLAQDNNNIECSITTASVASSSSKT
jgi:hypothetical protein